MNHIARAREEIQATGQDMKKGWALKLQSKGGMLPEHVSITCHLAVFSSCLPCHSYKDLYFSASAQAKRAIKDIFNDGSATGRKVSAEEAAKMLRERFPEDTDAWLKPSQV